MARSVSTWLARVFSTCRGRSADNRPRVLGAEHLEGRLLLATTTLTPAKDNTLVETSDGGRSNGLGRSFIIGTTGEGRTLRGILAFDLAGAGIPLGSTITEAQLELTVLRAALDTVEPATIHRVLQDWGEGTSGAGKAGGGEGAPAASGDATWLHTFHEDSFWSNPGGDFTSQASATSSVATAGTAAIFASEELVADVQRWVNFPNENFGWIVLGNESTDAENRTGKHIHSKDTVTGTPPRLSLTYTEPTDPLTLAIDAATFSERGGTTMATVSRPGTVGDVTIYLSSSDTSEVTVPDMVTIEDGSDSATFMLSSVDDDFLDGSQTATIQAVATGFIAVADTIEVTDEGDTATPAPTTATIEERRLSITASDNDDALTLRVDRGNLVVSDPNNRIAIGPTPKFGAHEISLPLSAFPEGIAIATGGGTNRVTLDATVTNEVAGILRAVGSDGHDEFQVQGELIELNLGALSEFEEIDLRGSGGNSLSLDVSTVLQNADETTDRLSVIADADDQVSLGAGWSLTGTEFNEQFFRVLEQDAARFFLSGPANWQNPIDPLDTSNDGQIAAVSDILPLINELNIPQRVNANNRFIEPTSDSGPPPFMDVNGDGFLSAVGDILPIINFVNNRATAGAEGEWVKETEGDEAPQRAAIAEIPLLKRERDFRDVRNQKDQKEKDPRSGPLSLLGLFGPFRPLDHLPEDHA